MTHPHNCFLLNIREQIRGVVNKERCLAILASGGSLHSSPQLLHHQLHAIAHAKDGNAEVPNFWITLGSILVIDGVGPPERMMPLGANWASCSAVVR